uniref:Protein kinase domain-containing protein n=2 Tax=Rhizophagus irregularis (strain DAOM 181602 / DAOM 197198 / MUCL 43194) TaxID=747089 RepID=U9UEJ2_RHIID
MALAACARAYKLTDLNIHNTIDKQNQFLQKTILADKSLTKKEKLAAINLIKVDYDYYKILLNEGTRRICENCSDECLATLYCEHCVRNYLKANFSNWTSGNNDIDNLIQQCQMETIKPDSIVEWIPYNNLKNINFLTKGGYSKIYTAGLIDGRYDTWDSKGKQLKRFGDQKVVLKKLENIESANRSWFEECKSHLSISNKVMKVVLCFGLTQDPIDGNYMLVMRHLDMDLKDYLQQNYNKLTWKEKIQIIFDIIHAVCDLHKENVIHRDLHSRNILFDQLIQKFRISDLAFCGPPNKPLNSIYGNLPYIAPELLCGKETTFASDIYSVGMLMWEISSGQPPFICKHNYDLAIEIVNGIRPKIVPGTPLKYKELMEKCWDADPTKRPDIKTLVKEINNINYYLNNEEQQLISYDLQPDRNFDINSSSINSLFLSSRVYSFKDLPESRNATKEEQEDDEKELVVNYKKVKLNHKGDDNLNSEQGELKISDDKMDLNYLLN